AGNGGIGGGDDDVDIQRALPGQDASDLFSDQMYVVAFDLAVLAGQVDVLKDAESPAVPVKEPPAADAVSVDDYKLARLHFPHGLGPDRRNGCRFRGQHVPALETSQNERTDAQRIAHADQTVRGHGHDRVTADQFL